MTPLERFEFESLGRKGEAMASMGLHVPSAGISWRDVRTLASKMGLPDSVWRPAYNRELGRSRLPRR